MYVGTTPKGKTEGVLAFVIPVLDPSELIPISFCCLSVFRSLLETEHGIEVYNIGNRSSIKASGEKPPEVHQCHMVLNGVHRDASHQGQQRTLALTQERFWWPMMAEDCHAIVRGCPRCRAFKGEVPRAPLCPIWAYAPLELVNLDYTSIESMMELNKPPMVENILVMMDHFMRYALTVVMKDQTAKTVEKVFYKHFIAVFGAPVKLLSDRGANFTSALVEELCCTFGIQKCKNHCLPYSVQWTGGMFPPNAVPHDWQVGT